MKRGNAKIASKYAKALLGSIITVVDNNAVEINNSKNFPLEVAKTLSESAEVQSILSSPVQTSTIKDKVIDSLFTAVSESYKVEPKILETVTRLLKLMVVEKRFVEFYSTAELYLQFVDSYLNSQKFEVTTAFALTPEEKKLIEGEILKKSANATFGYLEDSNILGGVIIKSGDSVIDNSLRTRISAIANNI